MLCVRERRPQARWWRWLLCGNACSVESALPAAYFGRAFAGTFNDYFWIQSHFLQPQQPPSQDFFLFLKTRQSASPRIAQTMIPVMSVPIFSSFILDGRQSVR
jgi:hypothetical protein